MAAADGLRQAAAAGDEASVRRILAPLSEAERAEVVPLAREIVKTESAKGVYARTLGSMLLLAYGVLAVTEIRRLGWRSNHIPEDLADVLRRRSPERLGPIVSHLLEVVGGSRAWSAVRPLVREGVVDRPDGDAYIVAMLTATRLRPATELLAADPGLLDVEVWRLFEVEGGGEDSLANHEKFYGGHWGDAFRAMAAADPAMRERLLDASLAALARDFSTYRAGWYSRFHESLSPTDDERARRVAGYLGLLRSRVRPTVSFAVGALTRIQRSGNLQAAELLDRIGPVIEDGPTGTAKAGLDLVARSAAGSPLEASRAAVVGAQALGHPSADVQRAALSLIGKLVRGPDPGVAAAVADRLGDVAASQRPAASTLVARLGGGAPRTAFDATVMAAPEPPPTRPGAALELSRALDPLTTIEALVDVAVSVLETGEPADDLERVLDGVRRFAGREPGGFDRLTAPIARRARTLLARPERTPFNGFDPRADVAAVLLAWTTGEVVSAAPGYVGISPGSGAFLSARARVTADDVAARRARPSVALPTHRGGWIEPTALVERLSARPPASPLDLVAAILRLGRDGRGEALARAAGLDGEEGAAVRYALGRDERVGRTAAWWVAAARVRSPGADDEAVDRKHPRLGPEAARAATMALRIHDPQATYERLVLDVQPVGTDRTSVDLPTALMLQDPSSSSWLGRSEPAMFRWMATIQPGDREVWAAVGSLLIGRNLDWWSAEWANRAFLEPFLEPWTPLGPHGLALVGIALGAKEAGERGLAADVARLAIQDGRLDAEGLARGLSAATAVGLDRPQRWARSLADVAADSHGHARAVAGGIGRALPVLRGRPPGPLVPLLRLLDELLARLGSSPPSEARAALEALAASGGQSGRLARTVLSRADPAPGETG